MTTTEPRTGYVWAVYVDDAIHTVHGSERAALRVAVAEGMRVVQLRYGQTLTDALEQEAGA